MFEISSDDPSGKVDANSVLKLVFEFPDEGMTSAIPEKWTDLDGLVQRLEELQMEYVALSARAAELPPEPTAQTEQLRDAMRRYDERVTEALNSLGEVIGRETVTDIALASAETGPLVGFARYIEERKDELELRASRLAARDSFEVAVRAYQVPRLGEIRQLHVPEYDIIPSRPFQPISRVAPIPTEAEIERLSAELQGAELVKASIEEIKANDTILRDHVRSFLAKLADRARALVDDLDALVGEWTTFSADGVLERLDGMGTEESRELRGAIRGFQDDVGTIGGVVDGLSGSVSSLRQRPPGVSATGLMQLHTGIESLLADVETVAGRLGEWRSRLVTIERLLPIVLNQARETADSVLTRTLQDNVTDLEFRTDSLLQSLAADVPKTMAAIEVIEGDFLQGAARASQAASALGVDDTVTIPRPLSELEPAVLDLRRTGIAPGDMVEIHVGFLRSGQGGVADRPEKSVRYSVETVLTGWHRQFSADVVFVTALSGPASDSFKPEAGISTEWHYYRRPPGGFLNWLDPGFGLHAVNLDQGAEAVEIGLGVNGSLWGGLVRTGFGYNLMVDAEREYWWIGFGLLGALNRITQL
jgi:hypothetical protein